MRDDEDIGYLKRAVEELSRSTALLHQIVKEHMAREEEDRKELLGEMKDMKQRIAELESKGLIQEAILEVLKKIGIAVIAILMVNLGDVSGLLTLFK